MVVEVLEVLELGEDGTVVVVLVFVVSFVFSVVGLTMVVLFSVFGPGEVPGATTVVSFCSQPPRSAALAKMQSSFFIGLDWLPILDKAESNRVNSSALPKCNFGNGLRSD